MYSSINLFSFITIIRSQISIISRISEEAIKILIPSGDEFGAKGAAYLASIAINKYSSLNQVVNKNKKIKKIFYPNLVNKKYYLNKFNKYIKLRRNLVNIW